VGAYPGAESPRITSLPELGRFLKRAAGEGRRGV